MGQVFYRDWTPGSFRDPTYNPNGAMPELESMYAYVPVSLPFQPGPYFDNRITVPHFYEGFVQDNEYTLAEAFQPYPVSDEAIRFAPEQPVRYDTYNQLAQRRRGPTVHGDAPTKGVYTGVADIGY